MGDVGGCDRFQNYKILGDMIQTESRAEDARTELSWRRTQRKCTFTLSTVLYVYCRHLLHSVGRFNICPSLNPKLACSCLRLLPRFKHPVIWVIELPILIHPHTDTLTPSEEN